MTVMMILGLILVPIGYEATTLAGTLFIIWITVLIGLLYDYEITDRNRLKSYTVSIDIHHIHKIIKEEKGVVVHYNKKEDGSIKTHRFKPKDADALIAKLKEINPNIQII